MLQQIKRHMAYAVAALALLITACVPQIRETAPAPPPVAQQLPENFPSPYYAQAAAQGKSVYRIDPARSLVTITVRRGGSLARLGHDHVVASHSVQGYALPDEGRADLYVPLNELSVDESALRVEAGLDTQPSEADIAGTRANMLDKVLQTQEFPFALIRVSGMGQLPLGISETGVRLTVGITLHGITRTFEVPAQRESGSGELSVLSVAGWFEFNQSDFGITPFSVLGGMIKVQDRINLRFRIYARPS